VHPDPSRPAPGSDAGRAEPAVPAAPAAAGPHQL